MIPQKLQKRRVAYGLPESPMAFLEASQDMQTIMAEHIKPNGSYRPLGIMAALKAKGVIITHLAELHGYSDAYFRQVINRERRDVTVENIIAKSLNLEAKADRMWDRQMLCEVANA